MPTNAQLFAKAGRTLFGPNWSQPMAELLGWPLDDRKQNRTVQRIKAASDRGEAYRIAPGVFADIAKAARQRSQDLQDVAAELDTVAEG